MLATSPEIEVVGTARSGREALAAFEKTRPDVICTDYQMPEMDGLSLIQQTMATFPRPILVVSSIVDPRVRDQIFPLLAAGAVDVLAKSDANSCFEQAAAALVQKVKLLSGVVVISRRPQSGGVPENALGGAAETPISSQSASSAPVSSASERAAAAATRLSNAPQTFEAARLVSRFAPSYSAVEPTSAVEPAGAGEATSAVERARAVASAPGTSRSALPRSEIIAAPAVLRAYQSGPIRLIAIGASTGGPQVLQSLLARLPVLTCPILCVQHISTGFLQGLVDWLNEQCQMRVKIAENGEVAVPGVVYFPPEENHLEIDDRGRLIYSQAPPLGGHRPAVTVTFDAVARSYGRGALGVLLTGMGSDGAAGLEAIMRAGGATIAQNEASCVVFGMPKQAIARGAAHFVLSPDQIAEKMAHLSASH